MFITKLPREVPKVVPSAKTITTGVPVGSTVTAFGLPTIWVGSVFTVPAVSVSSTGCATEYDCVPSSSATPFTSTGRTLWPPEDTTTTAFLVPNLSGNFAKLDNPLNAPKVFIQIAVASSQILCSTINRLLSRTALCG